MFAVFGALIGLVGLLSLASSLSHDAARLLGRAGVASALVGLAVFSVESTSEGLGLSVLARGAGTATADERVDLIRTTRAIAEATHRPSLLGMALMVGLPLLLLGLAMVVDACPSWLGWSGTCVGAATVVVSVALFLSPDAITGFLLYGLLASVLAQLWLGVVAVVMLRRARSTVPVGEPRVPV